MVAEDDVWAYAHHRMMEAIEAMVPARGGAVSAETTVTLHVALRQFVDEWMAANKDEEEARTDG